MVVYFNNYAFQEVPYHVVVLLLLILLTVKIKFFKTSFLFFVLSLFIFYFFRIPQDKLPQPKNDILYSPAYGKILKIQKQNGYQQIAIFLSVFDAHYQICPYAKAKITNMQYKQGEFNAAGLFHKGESNEKMIYELSTDRGKIHMAQIAGLIARVIRPFVKIGDEITYGQHMGLIRFGSRVDLFIPEEIPINILVKEGDKVKAGISEILKFI